MERKLHHTVGVVFCESLFHLLFAISRSLCDQSRFIWRCWWWRLLIEITIPFFQHDSFELPRWDWRECQRLCKFYDCLVGSSSTFLRLKRIYWVWWCACGFITRLAHSMYVNTPTSEQFAIWLNAVRQTKRDEENTNSATAELDTVTHISLTISELAARNCDTNSTIPSQCCTKMVFARYLHNCLVCNIIE